MLFKENYNDNINYDLNLKILKKPHNIFSNKKKMKVNDTYPILNFTKKGFL